MTRKRAALFISIFIFTIGTLTGCNKDYNASNSTVQITNVSYDPTRELYDTYNAEFEKYWKDKTGQEVTVIQSHGGSGKQARAVIEGNDADIVTLALANDITMIEEAGLIDSGWMEEFNNNSSPYTSTIVFLVRKGNEKNIKDWSDLVKNGVEIITPNPKTSGGARWNFLAAWGYADNLYRGEEAKIKEFMKDLYKNVIVLDSGARGSTTTFVENGQGDVLVVWENEAFLTVKAHPDEYEIITPSISVLAQPPAAVVDEVAKKNGTEEVAKAYLEYLYSDIGQRIAGDNYYRPSNPEILKEYEDEFDLNMKLVTIDDFGGWKQVNEEFFQDGAVFDQIYQ